MHLQEWTMEEQEQLIHFMTKNTWPYHGNSHPGRELIEKAIEEGGYESDEVKTFWVENENGDKVGIVKIYDLQDQIPLFDLRIADVSRGHGYGPKALRLVAEYVFGLSGKKIRLEGHTRQDNLAMRKTFERAGFVKEAHMRKAWFSPKENSYYDAVTYGITREDFIGGTTTPVIWEDGEKGRSTFSSPQIPNFPDSFESERLVIRAPQLGDAQEAWNAIRKSLPALRKWMPWAQPEPELHMTEESLRKAVANFITREDLRFHLYTKETGEFVGSSGLHRIDWAIPKFEIGYWLATEFEGQGYMTEAVQRIEQFAFEQLGARRVEIRCEEGNTKSRSVAERAGFILEGTLKQDSLSPDGNVLRNTCIYAKID
ncbi:GNAT family N-acetyltransferase [Sporosarcina limicola]|uniref:RimJ/RimL family protein N-acetyltransferase n=1 Tax=Sporosarcina limicola TaxID=34101 RepID=A0A927MI87_9BACL|nr:GNAT family N-acetyltransferase [Sporosarcina limicola]MBE1555140.1 RimJ/RimL family protein N-acetyltransferase [Sporosarcina limicola]